MVETHKEIMSHKSTFIVIPLHPFLKNSFKKLNILKNIIWYFKSIVEKKYLHILGK
jgi:hypothetical protein